MSLLCNYDCGRGKRRVFFAPYVELLDPLRKRADKAEEEWELRKNWLSEYEHEEKERLRTEKSEALRALRDSEEYAYAVARYDSL